MRPYSRWIPALPFIVALVVWLSPLSFVPVPWPDDSAFYFVAKSLFHWPPRWVMIPQSPFEPTYREFNFNTMPLFPILIGLGRLIGIDGSHGLKLWPLAAWASTGAFLAILLRRRGLAAMPALALTAAFALDPELRWASVLIRPESLIALFGLLAIAAAAFEPPRRFRPRGLWDPVSACLALAAYAHFNSVHLVLPVAVALLPGWRRLLRVGCLTALYLSPWALVAIAKWGLFIHQMELQWGRLAVGNDWLSSVPRAVEALFQSMGSPEPWSAEILLASYALWIALAASAAALIVFSFRLLRSPREQDPVDHAFLGSAAWVLSSCYLWHTKPEVWFVYYIHVALWAFLGFSALKFARARNVLSVAVTAMALLFLEVDTRQAVSLASDPSWRWQTYHRFVDCVDERLTELSRERGPLTAGRPFQVWCPTFPDITVELSRRHPDWELTRTNDFHSRIPEALAHGRSVDAVVVTEIWGQKGRVFAGPASLHPDVQSVWMNWRDYFLHQLNDQPGWMPNRYVCGTHRWQAFLYMR